MTLGARCQVEQYLNLPPPPRVSEERLTSTLYLRLSRPPARPRPPTSFAHSVIRHHRATQKKHTHTHVHTLRHSITYDAPLQDKDYCFFLSFSVFLLLLFEF